MAAVLSYLEGRGNGPGPLFVFQDGRYLTRARLVKHLREGLKTTKVNEENYCGHSFRIGAATTAASRGIEDSIIKTLRQVGELGIPAVCEDPRRATYSLHSSSAELEQLQRCIAHLL